MEEVFSLFFWRYRHVKWIDLQCRQSYKTVAQCYLQEILICTNTSKFFQSESIFSFPLAHLSSCQDVWFDVLDFCTFTIKHWSDVFCDVLSNTNGICSTSLEPLASKANSVQTIVTLPTICTWKFRKTVNSEQSVTLELRYIHWTYHQIIIKYNHVFLFKNISFVNKVLIWHWLGTTFFFKLYVSFFEPTLITIWSPHIFYEM